MIEVFSTAYCCSFSIISSDFIFFLFQIITTELDSSGDSNPYTPLKLVDGDNSKLKLHMLVYKLPIVSDVMCADIV